MDQDALGVQARRVREGTDGVVYAKPLEDGSLAVGLFNPSDAPTDVAVAWSELGLSGRHVVRDLWRQRDIDAFTDRFTAQVASHGVVMLRVR